MADLAALGVFTLVFTAGTVMLHRRTMPEGCEVVCPSKGGTMSPFPANGAESIVQSRSATRSRSTDDPKMREPLGGGHTIACPCSARLLASRWGHASESRPASVFRVAGSSSPDRTSRADVIAMAGSRGRKGEVEGRAPARHGRCRHRSAFSSQRYFSSEPGRHFVALRSPKITNRNAFR